MDASFPVLLNRSEETGRDEGVTSEALPVETLLELSLPPRWLTEASPADQSDFAADSSWLRN